MVEWRIFPLLSEDSPRRGGCAIKKKSRSVLGSRRRGGVQISTILWDLITTPSAPQRRLRDILLMSRPPLLGEEGKITAPRGRGYPLTALRAPIYSQVLSWNRTTVTIQRLPSLFAHLPGYFDTLPRLEGWESTYEKTKVRWVGKLCFW